MSVLGIATLIAVIAAGAAYTQEKTTGRGPRYDAEGRAEPTERDIRELEAYIQRKGRLPETDSEFKSLGGFWENTTRGQNQEWMTNLKEIGEEFLNANPEYATEIAEGMGVEDFHWDESKIHQAGTKEGDLFDFYKGMGDSQAQISQTEIARSERDMQIEMAQQRSQITDEVRKRRQNQLRSGLSSAQIANEEIQMLLMGQQAQQQTAQQHFDARSQVNQQKQMNPFMAELQTRQHIQGGAQGASAFYASSVMDPINIGKNYGAKNPATQIYIDSVTDKNTK